VPGHSRAEIWMVWMPHDNVPFPFDDLKSIRTIQTTKIVLPPSEGRTLHVFKQVLTLGHLANLPHRTKERTGLGNLSLTACDR
jgi:hypothetical protein